MKVHTHGRSYRAVLVALVLLVSMMPWVASVTEAGTDWKREYENSIGKKCPTDNMKGHSNSYFWCQCTSYVAFRLSRAGVSAYYYQGNGNAYEWASRARAKGIKTGRTPQKGAVYMTPITSSEPYGHVMFVEDVSNGQILVTDYNENGQGEYRGSRWITPRSSGEFIYFSNVNYSDGGNGGGSSAPSKPKGLTIKDIKSNKAKIDWDSQSGVKYFCVNWSRDNVTPQGCDVKVDGKNSSYKPTDLRSNKTHYVWVQACNGSGVCSSAAKTEFKTKK